MTDNSTTRKAAFWVGVVFLLGATLGGVLGYVFAHRSYAAPAPLTDSQRAKQKVERLTSELNLSIDQQKQIDDIILEIQNQYKTIHQSVDPQIDVARQKGRERIRGVLTPDQKPKFEDFLKRLDEERKKNAAK